MQSIHWAAFSNLSFSGWIVVIRAVQFPKEHPEFAEDFKLIHKIARIEDFIELSYQASTLKDALSPVVSLIETSPISTKKKPIAPELKDAIELILGFGEATPKTQVDQDWATIQEMKSRLGSAYVLFVLEPKLATSFETLFSGVVTGFVQMFNDTKVRYRLHADKVFQLEPGLKAFFYDVLIPLRNDQYAHKASAEGQHELAFYMDDVGGVIIDENPVHYGYEFYVQHCKDVLRCIVQTEMFLKKLIFEMSSDLVEGLSVKQLAVLRNAWAEQKISTGNERRRADPLSKRRPKPKPKPKPEADKS